LRPADTVLVYRYPQSGARFKRAKPNLPANTSRQTRVLQDWWGTERQRDSDYAKEFFDRAQFTIYKPVFVATKVVITAKEATSYEQGPVL